MNTKLYLKMFFTCMAVGALGVMMPEVVNAQICTNNKDSLYSLNLDGGIFAININNATNGPVRAITGPPPSPDTALNSNGLGYSSLDGKFYFFNRCATAGIGDAIQFVSYNMVTHTMLKLLDPPNSLTATDKIRSGCVNNLGTGYYTMAPNVGTSGSPKPSLFYYNISANHWDTITQHWEDAVSHANLDADFRALNSGDMAFDGAGNLWILASSTSQYALYEIKSTVNLTTPKQAKIIVTTYIPKTNTPSSNNVSFTGLGFNSTGIMYLTTGGYTGTPVSGNNNLWRLDAISGGIDSIGKFATNDMGGDLTSCSFPIGVLAPVWIDFTASAHDGVQLAWKAHEDGIINGYTIQHSSNGAHWQKVAFVDRQFSDDYGISSYTYTDNQSTTDGNNYYRVIQASASGRNAISSIRIVSTKIGRTVSIGPNPAKDVIYIYNRDNSRQLARVFDRSGRLVFSQTLEAQEQSLSVSRLPKGSYVLMLSSASDAGSSYQFIKW